MVKPTKINLFEPVFGQSFAALPAVFHKHYAGRSHSHDVVALKGVMQFHASGLARALSPFLRLAGLPPLFNAADVPATVQIVSQPDRNSVAFHREFEFAGRKPVIFITEMQPIAGNQLIDWTKDDIGWHMEMTNADNRINMRHLGYKMRMFGKVFAAPCGWLLGECNAWEIALDDNRFSLTIEIRRNGKLFYGYSGEFEVVGVMRRD